MYCDNCGCELGPDMKVCPVCGKKVEDMAADNGGCSFPGSRCIKK